MGLTDDQITILKESKGDNKMLIRTITDEQNGRKWEIFKKSDNEYFYIYYEFFKQIGWRFIGREGDHNNSYLSKDYIQYQFDILV